MYQLSSSYIIRVRDLILLITPSNHAGEIIELSKEEINYMLKVASSYLCDIRLWKEVQSLKYFCFPLP